MKPSTNQPSVNKTGPATAPSASQGLRGVAIGDTPWLRQAHLKADALRCGCARVEWTLSRELLEASRRVGPALEHLQRGRSREGAPPAQAHLLYLEVDVGVGCLTAHVLDNRRPALAKDPIHLVQGAGRMHKVLEGGLADDEVE